MSSRYHGRKKKITDQKRYKELLDKRGVRKIKHFATPKMNHPTAQQREEFTKHVHIWKDGDRFYKLAHKHYGDARYWWVIAWWNLRPTESHVEIGEGIRIPGPLQVAMSILKKGGS